MKSFTWALTVSAVVIGILIQPFTKVQSPPSNEYDQYFSDNYYQARSLFRRSAAIAQAELRTIPYPIDGKNDLDLSIDFAIIRGEANESLVIHMSGTHGVEGFAGSAIQSAVLSSPNWTDPLQSTLVFVHAVNPFGFAKLRRVNENNVDLNRNHLTSDEFAAKRAKDPNQHGYMDLMSFINPVPNASIFERIGSHLSLIMNTIRHGFSGVKSTIATGTYHVEKGIFYGGQQLELSHQLLHEFFSTQFDLTSFKRVSFVDVHTGLGPAGYDTNQVRGSSIVDSSKTAEAILPGLRAGTEDSASDGALAGYEHAGGFAMTGYINWFPNTTTVVGITQEFGTKSGILVLEALRIENAATQYHPENRMHESEALRDAFYLHWDPLWKYEIGSRGRILLETLVQHERNVVVV